MKYRPLRIGDPDDLALLHAISRGEFATAGFRNRELRRLLHPTASAAPKADQQRLSAIISRKLRLLRAHGPALSRSLRVGVPTPCPYSVA